MEEQRMYITDDNDKEYTLRTQEDDDFYYSMFEKLKSANSAIPVIDLSGEPKLLDIQVVKSIYNIKYKSLQIILTKRPNNV